MLEDQNSDVRQHALKMYIAFAQYCLLRISLHVQWAEYQTDDVHVAICSGETFLKILSMFYDQNSDVRQSALELYIALVQHS
jgi:hypothetical protein